MNENLRHLLAQVASVPDFHGVQFDSINTTNALGDNALHCVCVWGDLDAARLLVENGIDIHQCGEFGFTPLKVAGDFGFREIVDFLIAQGADPKEMDAEPRYDPDANTRHLDQLSRQIELLDRTNRGDEQA